MKLPNLDKNAFLSIYIKNSNIYAELSYVDYTSGRYYSLNDITSIFGIEHLKYSSDFWREYFAGISEKFNWEIFRGREIVNMAAEGFGVSGISVYVNGKGIQTEKLVGVIREVSYDITIQFITNEFVRKILEGISQKSGYEDIIYLNLDTLSVETFRFTKSLGPNLLNMPLRSQASFSYADVRWEKRESLIENIKNTKLKAFLSNQVSEDKLVNTWANFINSPFEYKGSNLLQDVVRSYMTIQLLTILNENPGKFDNIGATRRTTLVVLTGSLLPVLTDKKISLAILDGLELRGDVDVLIDSQSTFLRKAKSVIEGIENTEFIFSITDVVSNVTKYVVSEGNPAGQRKVIFTGKLESAKFGVKDIYAFSNEITFIPLNSEKEFLNGRFVQGSFWGEKYQSFELFSDPKTVTYSNLIIDGRNKPVIYGPDSRSNTFKLNSWINESN